MRSNGVQTQRVGISMSSHGRHAELATKRGLPWGVEGQGCPGHLPIVLGELLLVVVTRGKDNLRAQGGKKYPGIL